jgi:hypothetical protein
MSQPTMRRTCALAGRDQGGEHAAWDHSPGPNAVQVRPQRLDSEAEWGETLRRVSPDPGTWRLAAQTLTRTFSLVLPGLPPAQTARVPLSEPSWSMLSARCAELATTERPAVYRGVRRLTRVPGAGSHTPWFPQGATMPTAQRTTRSETPFATAQNATGREQLSTPRVRLVRRAGHSYGPLVLPAWSAPLLAGHSATDIYHSY